MSPLSENPKPCWEATCDNCGEGDNTEYTGSFHYESRADALKELRGYGWEITDERVFGWEITDERVLCEDCSVRAHDEAEAQRRAEAGGKEPPDDHAPNPEPQDF